jgi:hypothetical protein
MKTVPLDFQNNAEFATSLPFSQHSRRNDSHLFAVLELAKKNRSTKIGSVSSGWKASIMPNNAPALASSRWKSTSGSASGRKSSCEQEQI